MAMLCECVRIHVSPSTCVTIEDSDVVPCGFLCPHFTKTQVAEVRKGLEEREGVAGGKQDPLLKGKKGGGGGAGGTMDSHMRDVKKAEDNRRMREAFGLGDDFKSGEAFDEDAQERKKEERRQ